MYKKQAALLFTSVLGVLFSVYATILTVEVRKYNADVHSICSINALFDCTHVAASDAALLLGVPVAWWAFIYYLWTGSVVIWTFISSANQRPIMTMALIISTFAMMFTLYKGLQMIFQLRVICLICIIMYLANIAITLLLINALGLKLKQAPGRSAAISQQIKKESRHISFAAYMPGVLSIIFVFLTGHSVIQRSLPLKTPNTLEGASRHEGSIPNDTKASNPVSTHFAQTRRAINLVSDIPMWGNPQAKVTVVEFSDFQCPFCRIAASQLRDVLSEFSNYVKLYFIHYPLDKSINPYITTTGHRYAGLAARAAFYAFDRGKFWDFHNDLFQRQTDLSKETIFSLVQNYGWNIDEFRNAVESTYMIDRVRAHIKLGQSVEIQGTPAIYINGRHVEQWQDLSVLRQIIKHEIQNSGF
jgi:protein-disulfide isomerase/uncharacterized membrane protein